MSTDYPKKYWWIVLIAVPIIVVLIPIFFGNDNDSIGGNSNTVVIAGNKFNTINVVINQAKQSLSGNLPNSLIKKLEEAMDLMESREFGKAIPLLESVAKIAPVPALIENIKVAKQVITAKENPNQQKTGIAVGVFEFKWPGGDCWDIYRNGMFVTYHCGTSKQALQTGKYKIKPKYNRVFKPFEVAIKGAAVVGVEKGGIFEFKWPGDDCWDLFRKQEFVVYHCGTSSQALEEGEYIVKPKYNRAFEPFKIDIKKGKKLIAP